MHSEKIISSGFVGQGATVAQCSRRQEKVNEHMMHSARACKAKRDTIFLGTRVAIPGPRHLRDVSASLVHRFILESRFGPVASVVKMLVQV